MVANEHGQPNLYTANYMVIFKGFDINRCYIYSMNGFSCGNAVLNK